MAGTTDRQARWIWRLLAIAAFLPYAVFFGGLLMARVAIWPLVIVTGVAISISGVAVLRDFGGAGTYAAEMQAKIQRFNPFRRQFDERARRLYTLYYGVSLIVLGALMACFAVVFSVVGLSPT